MENTVLEKFHQGRQSLGTFSAIGSPLAVESLRYTGLDYVIVDTEHSPRDRICCGPDRRRPGRRPDGSGPGQ
jgi:2-keto-3-deoxy-L-rhamnonate aldolase RhmA